MNKGEVGTVGYELRREVRDALPPGLLTGMECLVLLELADDANDETRKGYPTLEKLAALLGREPRTVRDALASVWTKWVDVRVVLKLDKHGKPVYAFKGHAAEFVFPPDLVQAFADAVEARRLIAAWTAQLDAEPDGGPFVGDENSAPFEGSEGYGESVPSGGQRVRVSGAKGYGNPVAKGTENPRKGYGKHVPLPLSSPQESPHLSPQEAGLAVDTAEPLPVPVRLLFDLGASSEEVADVIDWITEHHVVRNDGWWLTAESNGTLAARLADARKALTRSAARPSRVRPDLPEHCGGCNPATRLIFRDTDTQTRRCPDCHPDAPRKDAS